jgi:hypothetical protein
MLASKIILNDKKISTAIIANEGYLDQIIMIIVIS